MARTTKINDGIRVNLFMKPEFVKAIDEYAEELGITRTGALNVIVKYWIDNQRTMDSIQNMGAYIQNQNK